MSHDDATQGPDVRWRPAGIGMPMPLFGCLGCGKYRQTLGAKGHGIRKRCAGCLEKRKGAA